MDTLSENDAKLFHKLMDSLIFFANKKLNIIKNCNSLQELHHNNIEKTIPIRDKIFSDAFWIDEYTKNNPDSLSSEELKIIASWKKPLKGDFFIIKYEKEHALFLCPKGKKVYGVKGITDSFNEKFKGCTPLCIQIRLLQFRDAIIYDGLCCPYSISFGGGMRTSLKAEAEEAMQKYGIITSLEAPLAEKNNSDENMLRFYMKTQDSRDRHYDQINKLKEKTPELRAAYRQAESGLFARDIKKSLKRSGVKGCFAVLTSTVVASALTEKELGESIKRLVPKDKQNWVYTFKI